MKRRQMQEKYCVRIYLTCSNAMYDEIRQYSVSEGLPEQMVNTIVDPVVIKLLNKARLYDQGKKVATKKESENSD